MQWLNADPKNLRAFQRSMAAWKMLDRMPANAAGLPRSTAARPIWKWGGAVGAAAAVMALLYLGEFRPGFLRAPAVPFPPASVSPCALHLSDGTTVYLNSGSEVVERFTPAERHVLLLRGEANFEVAKNPGRPFVVRAASVEVRDVGTVFNVCLKPATVEVMVSEGQVRVAVAPSAKISRLPQAPFPTCPGSTAGNRRWWTSPRAPWPPQSGSRRSTLPRPARVLEWKQPLLASGRSDSCRTGCKIRAPHRPAHDILGARARRYSDRGPISHRRSGRLCPSPE